MKEVQLDPKITHSTSKPGLGSPSLSVNPTQAPAPQPKPAEGEEKNSDGAKN